MQGTEKSFLWGGEGWGERQLLRGNKLRGRIGNIENFTDFHFMNLTRLFLRTLFTLNFARQLMKLISCPTAGNDETSQSVSLHDSAVTT